MAEGAVIAVLVTHDVDEAIRPADRIFVLSPRPVQVIGESLVESPRTATSAAEARIETLRIPA